MKNNLKKKFNFIAIICIVIFSVTLSQKTLQNDTFYTIKIGEHIVNTKKIDMEDPFSLHEGLKYTYPHWLYDTGMYIIYNTGEHLATNFGIENETGGLTAIYISTIIFAIILGISIYITNIKISNNHIISFILTLGVLYCLKNFIAARAQLVTYLCFTFEILFIEQLLKTGKKRYGIGLIIIAILIANLHAAVWYMFFILTLPYFAETLCIKLMESNLSCKLKIRVINKKIAKLKKKLELNEFNENADYITRKIEILTKKIEDLNILKEKRDNAAKKMENNSFRFNFLKRNNIKLLIIFVVICVFTGLLTPQTSFEPYTYIIKTLKGNSTSFISEHLPTVLIESSEALVILVIISIMLIFTDTKVSLKDIFMLAGLTIMTLMSRRHLALLALIGVYSLNIIIWNFIKKDDKDVSENKLLNKITTPFGVAVIVLLAILCGVSFYGTKYKEGYIDEQSYPVGVAEYLNNNLEKDKIRIYNSYNFGSYLLYKDIPVFVDSRCDLYTPEFNEKDIVADALDIEGLNVYYEDMFKQYSITHIITYDDSRLKMMLEHDDNYKIIYQDDNFYLFERVMIHEGEN